MQKTQSLKSLAFHALERLERNKRRHTPKTNPPNFILRSSFNETKKDGSCSGGLSSFPHAFNPYGLSSLRDTYEERLAITEYDGQQSPLLAKRMAYVEAWVLVFSTLPYKEGPEQDWFSKRLQAAKEWLSSQGFELPEE